MLFDHICGVLIVYGRPTTEYGALEYVCTFVVRTRACCCRTVRVPVSLLRLSPAATVHVNEQAPRSVSGPVYLSLALLSVVRVMGCSVMLVGFVRRQSDRRSHGGEPVRLHRYSTGTAMASPFRGWILNKQSDGYGVHADTSLRLGKV